jgi:ABC-2 type transport system permease protein
MSTTTVPAVRLSGGAFAHDLRAIKVVWHREMIRFRQDRLRIVSSLVQPILYVFVLGTGLASLTESATGDVSLKTFMFPGVIATTVLFTAMFSAISIVWDREFGFLREMLVAPVRRSSILIGKCLGGATVATFQGMVVLLLAGFVDVPYSPVLMITLIGEMLLLGFTFTAFGLVIAARIRQMQAMMGVMQMLLLPLMFLSGAVYPLVGLPGWLNFLVHINPLTYAVHPMRDAVFAHIDADATALANLNPPLTWFGWTIPVLVQLGVVAVSGIVFLTLAIVQFERAE